MDSSGYLHSSQDLRIGRALTNRYLVALSLVAALSTAAWWSMHRVISEQKTTAAIVNVSGRQRMLSQRTALFAELLEEAANPQRPELRLKLGDSIRLMERSHRGLIHGDAEMGLPGAPSSAVRALYFDGADPLDEQVRTYIKTVDALLALDDARLNHSTPELQYILRSAPTTLLKSLDQMVGQYQLEGETSVRRIQLLETTFWGITLLLLALEAWLIFRPIVTHVRAMIGKLQHATDELQSHRGQLQQLVEQRTAELESRTEALAQSEEKFRLVSTVAKDAIVIINPQDRVIYWNPAATEIFGYESAQVIGMNLHRLIAPERFQAHAQSGFQQFSTSGTGNFVGKTLELTAMRSNGQEFPIELSVSAFRYREAWHAMGILRDITQRKETENRVRQLAFYDELTKLPNRRLLIDRLSQAIASSRRSGRYAAVMFLDLDNFKPLNDAFGHEVGDLLLVEVGKRLTRCVREFDTVARFGGDEFVVLLHDLDVDRDASSSQAAVVAEKIRATLAVPYSLGVSAGGDVMAPVQHQCNASIGLVLLDKEAETPHEILKRADAAMYEAKKSGRNAVWMADAAVPA